MAFEFWKEFHSRPSSSGVIDQNVQNIVLIIILRVSWPNKILMSFLSFSDKTCLRMLILFSKKC